jgi:hypothetical protein
LSKKDKKDPKSGDVSPWLVGVSGIKGVVPPGRRLSPVTERRPTKWSASGVNGVRPPGKLKPGEGPASEAADKLERKRALKEKAAKKEYDEAKRPAKTKHDDSWGDEWAPFDKGRPSAGFTADPFAELQDPPDIKTFLEIISDFAKTTKFGQHAAESLAEMIQQSHAPFEIIVAFTLLSALVGKDSAMRRRYTAALERGAKSFFNLAIRLDKKVKPPRGLVPETMDAIFYDLPSAAYQIPFSYSTDAFCRMLDLLRGERDHELALMRFARGLYSRFIERRSYGDRPLKRMFPWDEPEWAPEEDAPPAEKKRR